MAALLAAGPVSAAPFANWLDATSPNGAAVRIWGEGDEFSAWFEAEDGHAVVYDAARRGYVYATKDESTGALAATAVVVGEETASDRAALASVPLHLRDTSEAAARDRERRIADLEKQTGRSKLWESVKADTAAMRAWRERKAANPKLAFAPPSHKTLGTVVGLTLLIDFPVTNAAGEVTGTLRGTCSPGVTYDNMNALFNGEDFSEWGNKSSVRKYYEDVSCGRFSYTNIVLRGPADGWFLLPKPREYYDDSSRADNGPWIREFQSELFRQIRESDRYETEYLPLLRTVSVRNREFRAFNYMYAGHSPSTWSRGLWPHSGGLSGEVKDLLPIEIDGVTCKFGAYQMTYVGSSPAIGVLCHENGHMVCGFPDFYDYDYGNLGGAGGFSLMGSAGTYNPVHVDPYLRAAAGWLDPMELPANPCTVTVSNRLDCVWKYTNLSDPTQYYLIENRQEKGRDYFIPASGVLIWRCDEKGSDVTHRKAADGFAEIAPHRYWAELIPEQADGLYQIEQRRNGGDRNDTWRSDNDSSGYTGLFNADSVPCARWRDAGRAGIRLSNFSANGDVMTFDVGDASNPGAPVLDASVNSTDGSATIAVAAKSLGSPAKAVVAYADVTSTNAAGKVFASYTVLVGRLTNDAMTVEKTISGLALGLGHVIRVRAVPEGGGAETVLTSAKVRFDALANFPGAVEADDNIVFWFDGGGDKGEWYVTAEDSKVGRTCIRSKAGGLHAFRFGMTGPGTLTYWWKASCGDSCVLACWRSHDSRLISTTDGGANGEWVKVETRVPAGFQQYESYYWNVQGNVAGNDCGYIDSMTFVPDDALPPAAPANVSATQGTQSPGVAVSWEEASGARSYRVWRGESSDPAKAVLVAETDAARCLDDCLAAGMAYWYWVESVNLAGTSAKSGPAVGWAPAPLAVLGGDFETCVARQLVSRSFTATGGRPPYRWTQSSTSNPPDGMSFEESSGTLYGLPAEAGKYWIMVVVTDANGTRASGAAWLPVLPASAPDAVSNLSAEQRQSSVYINWDDQPWGTTNYVYMSETDDFSTAGLCGKTTGSYYTYWPPSGTVDRVRYFWVVPQNWLGTGPASESVRNETRPAYTYFVDGENGRDTNDGLTVATAMKTIWKAVSTAPEGGTVRVLPGVYDGFSFNVSVPEKRIRIESTGGPSATFIDGGGRKRCATLSYGPAGTNATLAGFTLVNGRAEDSSSGSAMSQRAYGGGAYGGVLERCVISNCVARSASGDAYGGAAFGSVLDACLVVSNSVICETAGRCAQGGGVYGGELYNCTVASNSVTCANKLKTTCYAAGAGAMGGKAVNSVFWGNTLTGTDKTVAAPGVNVAGVKATCCLTQTDPVFIGTGSEPWRLALTSPAFKTGDFGLRRTSRDLSDASTYYTCFSMGAYAAAAEPTVAGSSLPAVEGLRGRADEPTGGILLRWKPVPQAAFYRVYRANTKDYSNAKLLAKATTARYVDCDIAEGAAYWYRVVAADTNGNAKAVSSSTPFVKVSYDEDVADFYVEYFKGYDYHGGRSRDDAFEQIQAAADVAEEGDVVLVGPYTNYVTFNTWGTTLRIVSEAGPKQTVIWGDKNRGRCATLAMTRDASATNAVLEGFKLKGGVAGEDLGCCGGGVLGGVLNNCIICDCKAGDDLLDRAALGGGAAYSVLNNCILEGNSCLARAANSCGGGAAYCTLSDCIVTRNKASCGTKDYRALGAGLYCSTAYGSTIYENMTSGTGPGCGGGMYGYAAYNSIVWDNEADEGADVGGGHLTSLYRCCTSSDSEWCFDGCVFRDPKVKDWARDDFTLTEGSPCIDAGNVAYTSSFRDFEGNVRVQGASVDIGAVESTGAATAAPAPFRIVTRSLPGGAPGDEYSATLEAEGGAAPYRWSAVTAYGMEYEERRESQSYFYGGTSRGWRADEGVWEVSLPFDFPFYGRMRRTMWVNANGILTFDEGWRSGSYQATTNNLLSHAMVAVLWKDLRTDTDGGNIYTDIQDESVFIRWKGQYYSGSRTNVEFSVRLTPDGGIRCRYDDGNTEGGMVAVSAGDGTNCLFSAASFSGSMDNVKDVVFLPAKTFPAGLSLSSAGVVSGVPQTPGSWLVDVFATDSAGAEATKRLALNVDQSLFYTTSSAVPVAYEWLDKHPELLAAEGVDGDYEKAAKVSTGKRDATGRALSVYHDYLMGTDPADEDDVFEATIEMDGETPVVKWTPDLNEGGRYRRRVYTIWGKTNLTDRAWHSPTNDASRFFRVTVDMP